MNEKELKEAKNFGNGKSDFQRNAVLLLLLFLAVGLATWYIVESRKLKPIDVFKNAIKESSNYLKKTSTHDFDEASMLDWKASLTIGSQSDETSFDLSGLVASDLSEKYSAIEFDLGQGLSDIIDFGIYIVQDHVYMKSAKLYDGLIDFGLTETNSSLPSVAYDFDLYSEFLIKNMQESDFSESKVDLSANELTKETTKYTYTISEEVANRLRSDYIAFIEQKIAEGEIAESETLEEWLSLIDEEIEDFETIKINIYANLKEVYGIDVEMAGKKLMKFYYIDGQLEAGIAGKEYTQISDEGTLDDYDVKIVEDQWKFKGETQNDRLTVKVYYKLYGLSSKIGMFSIDNASTLATSNACVIDYIIDLADDSIEGRIEIETGEDEADTSSKVNMTMEYGELKLELDYEATIDYLNEQDIPDVTNAKKYDELSVSEWNDIISKLENAGNGTDLEIIFQVVGALITGNYKGIIDVPTT